MLLDVGFNKEVAEEGAVYFNKEEGNLSNLINKLEVISQEEIKLLGIEAKKRIQEAYTWDKIVFKYESLFLK